MRFRDDYWFLSNMFPAQVTVDGITYQSAEAAFQAQKAARPEDRIAFAEMDGKQAKAHGHEIRLRPDWDEQRVDVMRKVIAAKFREGTELAEMLVATGDEELIEDNSWGDTFWGRCRGKGRNWLGVVLMERRQALAEGNGGEVPDIDAP